MANPSLPIPIARMLLADWVTRLANEAGAAFTQSGSSERSYTIGPTDGLHVIGTFTDRFPFIEFKSSDPAQQGLVDALSAEAVRRVQSRDFGDAVWHSAHCETKELSLARPGFVSKLMEALGNQKRILGWLNVGPGMLVEFAEKLPPDWNEKGALVAPPAIVKIHVSVPAPCQDHFATHAAHAAIETVAAICSFALGRCVLLPPMTFPTRPEHIAELEARKRDTKLTLARKGKPLDIIGFVARPGGQEHFERLRAALLTFDAAMNQERDAIACVLYVVAAECLMSLATPWRDKQLTKRFLMFFEDLMPDELDEIVRHGNFEAAFGVKRGNAQPKTLRRRLLSAIYDYRSAHLHTGLRPSYRGFVSSVDAGEAARRALFADFAEAAILRYMETPFCSLLGHPSCRHTRPDEALPPPGEDIG